MGFRKIWYNDLEEDKAEKHHILVCFEIYIRCNNFSLEDACGKNVSVDGVCWHIKVHTIAIWTSEKDTQKRMRNESDKWEGAVHVGLRYLC